MDVAETPAKTYVGVREAARQLKLNASTVSRDVERGIIPNHQTDPGKPPLIDVEEARAARAGNVDQAKQRGPASTLFVAADDAIDDEPDDDGSDDDAAGDEASAEPARRTTVSFNKARTATEAYRAENARLDLEERRGSLLDKAEAVDAGFTIAQELGNMWASRQPLIAARLAGLSDIGAINAILGDEWRKFQTFVADEFVKRLTGQVPGEAHDAAA